MTIPVSTAALSMWRDSDLQRKYLLALHTFMPALSVWFVLLCFETGSLYIVLDVFRIHNVDLDQVNLKLTEICLPLPSLYWD